jgi:hypothetical protein
LVCRDVGRGTHALIDGQPRRARAAARALSHATSIGFITGFFVPRDGVRRPETDGPVGTALLAAALAPAALPVRIAVDSPCAEAVRAAVHETGYRRPVDEVGRRGSAGHRAGRGAWKRRREPCRRDRALRPQSRRPAAQHAGRRRLAVDRAARRPVHGGAWVRIGVGDGGNEIGMGKLPAGLIARTVPNGEKIACITSCDHLVWPASPTGAPTA